MGVHQNIHFDTAPLKQKFRPLKLFNFFPDLYVVSY